MLKSNSLRKCFVLIFVLAFSFKQQAQLNSVDAYGGVHKFMNSYYADPKQPWGNSFGLRYNWDFSWEWAAVFSAGLNQSSYNLDNSTVRGIVIPTQTKNTYAQFQLGLEWQWMTEIRTRMGGGRPSCKGSKAIIMANFKSYFMGGLDYQMLTKSGSDYNAKSVLNWFGGIGFEWYRLGANAQHGNNAFVPFTEVVYYSNLNGPYATELSEQKITLTSVYIRFGVKFTFGFPEKKFAWGGKK